MKKTKFIVLAGIIATASLLGACSSKQEPKDDTVYTLTGEKEGKEVEKKNDDRLPPLPTAQEMTDVMQTFDSYKEFKEKLLEVNVTNPTDTLTNIVIADDGVEHKTNVYLYQAKDGYFVIYTDGDKILKGLPDSGGLNHLSELDAKKFIEGKIKS